MSEEHESKSLDMPKEHRNCVQPCRVCDGVIREGRAQWACKACGDDVSLQIVFMADAGIGVQIFDQHGNKIGNSLDE